MILMIQDTRSLWSTRRSSTFQQTFQSTQQGQAKAQISPVQSDQEDEDATQVETGDGETAQGNEEDNEQLRSTAAMTLTMENWTKLPASRH